MIDSNVKVRIVTLETTAILIHRVGGFVMESVIIPRLGDIAAVVREAALVVLVKSLAAEVGNMLLFSLCSLFSVESMSFQS